MGVALVTGPTAGIGREIAVELALQGHHLILVSRDETRLTELATELGDAEVLTADLSDRAQLAVVEQAAEGVDWLVNNAGYGLNTSFDQSSVAEEQELLDVLVTAVMRLTHAALPGMLARGHGRILNTSSIAGWVPLGTYSAAKAWVTVFSEGLAAQTPAGIHVTALCPGFTRTEFHERAAMDIGGPGLMWLDAGRVARQGIRDCERGTVLSIPSLRYRAVSLAARHTPRRILRTVAGIREEGR
ncbi:MAG: SDR family NAD(P)-dependent oxidoreductase [Micrococcales bacterium]|nr:SDR family NAD(P)-dependent oxidoreductase [Micrococcales bacterium]